MTIYTQPTLTQQVRAFVLIVLTVLLTGLAIAGQQALNGRTMDGQKVAMMKTDPGHDCEINAKKCANW